MFPDWTWVVGFWIGAAIGSFLNVVIYRVPRGLSISEPKFSFCPSCRHRLLGPDLVPILSWVFLGGKCRHCKAPISSRYVVVELVNASLWGLIWWRFLVVEQNPAMALAYSAAASTLVAAIFTDLQWFIIPDQVNAFLLLVGLVYNGVLIYMKDPRAWLWGTPSSIAGALVGIAALWGIAVFGRLLFGKDAMGHGDIKMARGIGAVLLPASALMSFGIAVLLGAVLGVVQILLRSRRPRSVEEEEEATLPPESLRSLLLSGLGYVLCIDVIGLAWPRLYERWFGENPYAVESLDDEPQVELTMIPFGPYLAAGAIVAMLFGPDLMALVEAYTRWASGV